MKNNKMALIRVLTIIFVLTPLSGFACFDAEIKNQAFSIIGSATDKDGNLVYTEYLTQTPDASGGKLEVIYRDPNDKVIGRKDVQYNCNPTTPSFILEDKVHGKNEGVRWNENNLESFQGDSVTVMEHPSGQAAVDSGFDNVIKLNWDKLINKESVKYTYLFARKNKFIKLKFSRSNPPQVIGKLTNNEIAFFKVSANNLLFKLLSSPIYVGYHIESKSLAYYYGPTNLAMLEVNEPLLITYQKS